MDFQLIITKMDDSSLKELMQLIPLEKINITKPPEKGLLMMTVTDCFGTNFYLGEILVTEASIEYKGIKGYGMVIGDEGNEDERAILAAVVDAIMKDSNGYLKHKVIDFITLQAKKITKAYELEKRLIAKTRVNFEVMAKR